MNGGAILLISEARGEFLMIERIRAELEARGRRTVHVTATAADVTDAELRRSGARALDAHPAYARAAAVTDLRSAIDGAQSELGTNLRRIWKADFRSWREGASDEEMARVTLGCLAAWHELLAEAPPLAGVWGEDGGHLGKRTAFLLAEQPDIRLWFLYISPLRERMLVLDNALNRFDASEFAATEPSAEERAYAHEFLTDLRASRIQFATPRDLSFGPTRLRRFGSLLVDRYVRRPPGAAQLYPFTFARAYAHQRATRAALRTVYSDLGQRRFVFHPIHAGFDAQISIRAPQWEDQLALIEHIARSLPYGYELAVKEHPFEVGALSLRRVQSLLRRRPEIRLLDPSIHAHTILPRCAAVTTINSTTGYEALFFRRPVVTFGHSPYRGLGLTLDVSDPFETPRLLLEAVSSPPPPEEEILRLVAFLLRHSYPARSLTYDVSPENLARYGEIFDDLAGRVGAPV